MHAEPSDKLVLVVDDDEGTQDLLAAVLRREGFRVEQALDGRDALRKAQNLLPDLILLDFMFPRHGGHELLILLQSGPTAAVPVVMISGCAKEATRDSLCLEPNVVDFMSKPIDRRRLVGLLHRTLQTKPSKNGSKRAGKRARR